MVVRPTPPTKDYEPVPLKVKNGGTPLYLDYKTFCQSTKLEYNNGQYADLPQTMAIKAEHIKLGLAEICLLTGTKIVIGEIIYNDLVTRLLETPKKKYVAYPRFISYVLERFQLLDACSDPHLDFAACTFSKDNLDSKTLLITQCSHKEDTIILAKPFSEYDEVDRGNSTKQSGSYVASTSREGGKSAATSTQSKNVRLENSFSALNDDEDNEWKDNTTWQHSQQVLDVLNESDSEVDELITLDDRGGNLKTF
ncbi:hypothetical protein Tco_1547000 [Tanacetum coccineum]